MLLRLLTAAGLAVDAYIHWTLAPNFDSLVGPGNPTITGGQLFRVEAFLALFAMVLVLVSKGRTAAVVAFVVAAGGVVAVLAYHYTDPGAIGPLPDMADPVWTTEKAVSAIAEAVAAVSAAAMLAGHRRRFGRR